jgi:glycosyltransferase involved in cell wall biosynthesis
MPLHSSHQPPLTPHQSPRSVRVLQLSTVHPWDDNRICRKICVSLVEDGYDVVLMAREANSDASIVPEGVELHVLPNPRNRILRGLISLGIWRRVRRLRPDIVHFHDPELIPAAILLSLLGYKTIYDVHEDYPENIRIKQWVPWVIRRPLALMMKMLEKVATRTCAAVFVVTDKIGRRFPQERTSQLRNYPRLAEVEAGSTRPEEIRSDAPLIFVGGLTTVRGICEMVEGLNLAESLSRRLLILGSAKDKSLQDWLKEQENHGHLRLEGWCTRDEVVRAMAGARCGMLPYLPTPPHVDALPTKLFEYMGAGLPIIASDFPLWREIIHRQGCGLLVDPTNVTAIAEAIDWMYQHPDEARIMGENGRRAIRSNLNWESEARKLYEVYDELSSSLRSP